MKTQFRFIVLAGLLLLLGKTTSAAGQPDPPPDRPTRVALFKAPLPVLRPLPDERFAAPWNAWGSSRPSLLEPTLYVVGLQLLGMGFLLASRREVTGFKVARAGNVLEGLTSAPVWDQDGIFFNYLAHPLWGSESYLRARRAHFSPLQSFLFSSAASVAWEYLIEAWAEHPSTQDLLFTSTLGSALGELRFQARRSLKKNDAWWARAIEVAVDPLDALLREATILPHRVSAQLNATVVTAPAPGMMEPASSGTAAERRMGWRLALSF